MTRKPIIIFASLIILFTGFIAFTLYAGSSTSFDSEQWHTADPVLKYRMARDLELKQTLHGMTIIQVKNLLGEPNHTSEQELFYLVDQPYGFKDGFSVILENGIVVSDYTHD